MSWPRAQIASIKANTPNALVGGPFGSDLTTRDYVPEGIPVIRGQNLSAGCVFSEEEFVYVSAEKATQLRANTAGRGDLVFTQRGTLGQVGLIPATSRFERYVISQSQMKLTVDPKKANARFVYHYFSLPAVVEEIKARAITSGVPHINLGILKELEIPLPPIEAQGRIASVASAYDDLIENNQGRIKLLEEAARRLYREWFVALRFPGHERVNVVDGVPQGWERVALANAVEVNPRTRADDDDAHPFVSMQGLSESSMVIADYEMRVPTGGAKFRNGDTLLARITPCLENGKTGFVQFLANDRDMASGSTEFIVMRSRQGSPYWVYCLARDESFREHAIRSMAGSDGRQRVNTKLFDQYHVLKPPKSVFDAFDRVAMPIFQQVQVVFRESQMLKQARDALLPRLMSGALVV
jgi:type I restriction enzyme, S subunit